MAGSGAWRFAMALRQRPQPEAFAVAFLASQPGSLWQLRCGPMALERFIRRFLPGNPL